MQIESSSNYKTKPITIFILVVFTILVLSSLSLHANDDLPELTVAQWREDLQFLHTKLVEIHPGVFERVAEEDFAQRVRLLHDDIPSLTSDEILVGFKRIVALIPDQHTVATSHDRREELFDFYPVRLIELSDGVFVLSADREYADIVGLRVLKVGDDLIDKALDRFTEIIPADSELSVKRRRALEMMAPRLVHGLGLTPDRDTLTLTVEANDGSTKTVEVDAIEGPRTTRWFKHSFGVPTDDYVTIYDSSSAPLPVSLGHPNEIRGPRDNFWFSFLEEEKAFYLRMNLVLNQDDEPLSAFIDRMWNELDRVDPERLIIDLRYNEGGNNFLVKPLIHGLIQRPELSESGKVFVLIGRNTFSAAVSTAAMIEREVGVVFIGEPTGQRPNHYSDTRAITAPNSLFRVEVSRYQWMFLSPWDRRMYIAPHVPVEESSADLLAGRDPVLESALSLEGYEPVETMLSKALDAGKKEIAVDAYQRHKAEYPDVWTDTTREMNRLGYQLLGDGRVEDAITVFELNAGTYPENANTWDSLGEAYLEAENDEKALQMYREALKLDPENEHAKKVVEKLSSASPTNQ